MRKLQQLSWLAGISLSLLLIGLARPGISQEDSLNLLEGVNGGGGFYEEEGGGRN
jgi:hypothetical protein